MKSVMNTIGMLSLLLGMMTYAPEAKAAHNHDHGVAQQQQQTAQAGEVANQDDGCCSSCKECKCEEGCKCCEGGKCTCENCECECCEKGGCASGVSAQDGCCSECDPGCKCCSGGECTCENCECECCEGGCKPKSPADLG